MKVVGRDGRLLEMNPAGLRMLEADSLAEVQARPLLAFLAVEHRGPFGALHSRVLAGESGTLEFEVVGLKGGRRWLETHAAPLRDAQGEVTALLGITRDITGRRRADEALREQAQMLDLAQLLVRGHADDRIVQWSRGAERFYGFTAAEAVGRVSHELFATRFPEPMPTLREKLLRDGHWEGELVHTLRDGRAATVASTWVLHRDETGRPSRIIEINNDISARKRAEEALRESEELWKFALEGAGDGVWDLHIPTRRILYSKRWKEMLGYAEDEIPDRLEEWERIVHPEDHPKALAALEAYLEGRTDAYVNEHRLRSKDGSYRWILSRGMAVSRDADGRPLRMVGTHTDVTERKEAEQALRASEERYRRLVDNFPNAVVSTMDRELRIVFVAGSELEAQRLVPSDVIGRRLSEILDPSEFAAIEPQLRGAFEGRVTSYETTYRGGDVFHANAAPLREADGTIRQIIVGSLNITEQRRTEAAHRKSEERYRHIVETAAEGIWLIDAAGLTTFVNPQMAALLGLEPDDMVGREVFRFMDESAREEAERNIARRRRGITEQHEFRLRHKDGHDVWTSMSTNPQFDESGAYTGALAMVTDITDRKRADQRIRDLNRTYAVLSDINQLIVRDHDPRTMLAAACRIAVEKGGFKLAWVGLLDDANNRLALSAQTGAGPDTLEILDTLIQGDPPAGCAFTRHALQTGEHGVCNDVANDPKSVSWRGAALQRGYRAMAAFPLKPGGKHVGVFNLYAGEAGFFDPEELRLLDELALDISFALEVHGRETKHLAGLEALRASEERFRQVVENIREVFRVTDPVNNRLLYVSPAYETVWGRACSSLYQTPEAWLDAIHPEDRPRIVEALATKQARGDYHETYRIIHPSGSVRWIRDRAFPVRDAAGEIHRIVGTAEDVTAQLQLEEQLRQSQKMEAIGQLAGGVAHDFNNILAAMMMQADLASQTENLPEEAGEMLEDLKASAERAASLTRQLLAFGRRQVMQTRRLDLNEIVTSLAKMLQRILGEDVRLQLSLHSRPLVARADAGMLDQVLLNLVVNARDAMPDGGQLTIETGEKQFTQEQAKQVQDLSSGRHVYLRVTDTGCGIPAENVDRIFEPFFTTKEPGKGTGLGLATVFGIVKQHGGSIVVESESGRGTTFHVYLPAADAADGSAVVEAAKPRARGGTETILVVEDEPGVRRLTRVVLERHGYKVLEAPNGVEALQVWERHKAGIHLLFTDIVMPHGIGGRDLAAKLRESNPSLRVVFTSGYSADIAGRELSLKEGQNFIQKPSSPQQLLETVRRALDH